MKLASPILLSLPCAEWLAPFLVLSSMILVFGSEDSGLIAHYRFDKGQGAILHDASAIQNHGKILGAVWLRGQSGAALDFDGVADHVDCGDDPRGRAAGPLSVCVWVRTNLKAQQHVLSRGGWSLYLAAGGAPVFETRNKANDAYDSLSAKDSIPLDEWAFIVASYDPGRQCMELFVNGKLSNTKPRTDGAIGGLFRSKLGIGRGFNGLIGEFRLYNRALPAEEIQRLYETARADRSIELPQTRLRLTPHLFYRTGEIRVDVRVSGSGELPAAVELRKTGDDGVIQKQPVSNPQANKKAEVIFSAKKLDPGDYEIHAAAASAFVTIPKKPSWFGSQAGVSDQVLAPWTPLQVSGAADLSVQCWGRSYELSTGPLPQQIVTAGQSILAEPIQLAGRANGRDIQWNTRPIQIERRSATKVILSQKASDAELELSVHTEIEYDGMIRVDCAIKPLPSARLERLTLEIPFKAEHATLMYQYRDALFKAPGAIPREGLARTFNPAIWIGDEVRGLQWFAESDQGWHLADPNRAIEIARDGDQVILRLNLISKPLDLKSPLAYTFGLQATPTKPITKDAWDYRITSAHQYGKDYAMETDQIGGVSVLDHYVKEGARTIFLGNWTGTLSYPAPIGHQADLHKLVKTCHRRGLKVLLYLGNQFSELAPEYPAFLDDFAQWSSGSPYSYGGYMDNYPPMRAQQVYSPCVGSDWRDLMLAGAARLMDEFEVDGFYLDGVGLGTECYNPHHDCGYRRADGSVGPSYSVFAGRDFIRRLYQIVKSRKPDGVIDLHPAAFWLSPVMAWADNCWDGETILGEKRHGESATKGTHLLDFLTPDMFRAQFMGRPWGVSTEFISYYVPYPYRQQFAMTLLHDIPIRSHNSESALRFLSSLWRVRDEFGCKQAEWLPYWKNSEFVMVETRHAYVSFHRHPAHGALAIVSNLGKQRAKVKARFDLVRLGLPPNVTATDALTKEAIPIQNGRVTLDLDSVDWKLVWIKP
ncbi:MAG: hypothetical protein HY360_22435 [Verrucomicrobia bacterium]|nr:hypothetical protein [Verrucomicrobiota bacterium]